MSARRNHPNRKPPARPSHPPDNSSKSHTPTGKNMRVVGVLVDDTSSIYMNTNTNIPLKDIIEQTEQRLTMTLQDSFHFEKPPKIKFCQIGPAISISRQTDVGDNVLHRIAGVSLSVPTAYATFIPDVDQAITNRLKEDRTDATVYRLQESTQTGGTNMLQILQRFEALQKSVEQQLSASDVRGEKRVAAVEKRSKEEVAAAVAHGEKRLKEEVAAAVAHGDRRVAAAVEHGEKRLKEEVGAVAKELEQYKTALHKLCRRTLLDQARLKILAR
ncbi:hypothetical protein F5146DRAFT_1123532 [Armillaria mellea]|nr:hypothetical protein F5146DRAFT_1123532 [Armillaria mellea]